MFLKLYFIYIKQQYLFYKSAVGIFTIAIFFGLSLQICYFSYYVSFVAVFYFVETSLLFYNFILFYFTVLMSRSKTAVSNCLTWLRLTVAKLSK